MCERVTSTNLINPPERVHCVRAEGMGFIKSKSRRIAFSNAFRLVLGGGKSSSRPSTTVIEGIASPA